MPGNELDRKPRSQIRYAELLPSQEPTELDVEDLHVQLGLALVHIEDVTEGLAERFQRDGSVGWRPQNPREPVEFSYNPHDQKIGIYVEDRDTKRKLPLVLCTTSKDSRRREIQRIEVLQPNGNQVGLLQSLPLLRSMTPQGTGGRTPVPSEWREIEVVSFAIGLSREHLYIVPRRMPHPSGNHPKFFSGVNGVRVIVGGWWKDGNGNRDKDIVGPVVDMTWDFDRGGFVSSRRAGEEVSPLSLLGTVEGPGLLDAVISAFVSPAEAMGIPVVLPESLDETGRRGKQKADAQGPSRPRISLNLRSNDE